LTSTPPIPRFNWQDFGLDGNQIRGVAQSGSASALGAEGRRFESCLPDQFYGFLIRGLKTTANTEFEKAIWKLQEALAQPKNEFVRDSVIRRFTICIDLAWKTSRKVMGTATSAPKDVIREMAQNGYITDVDTWLKSIDMRNMSSHTYKEKLAELVYAFAKDFAPELVNLVKKVETK
jgi:nucleotidyltransferase substrate binding protein (TIGR01987 family)